MIEQQLNRLVKGFLHHNFKFVCLLSGSFQMDRAAFAYIILCPCRCSGNGGSKRRSKPNSVCVTQSFAMQS